MLSEEPKSLDIPDSLVKCEIHASEMKVWTDCAAMAAAASVGTIYRLSKHPEGGQKLILIPVPGRYDKDKLAALLRNIQSEDEMVEISF